MADGDGEDEAARAFESLRAEVSLMRRAVERLAAERAEDGHAPDYSETLGVISQNLSATAQRVDALVKSPALSLTPEETSRQIGAASFNARREDHRLFLAAKQGMDEVATRLRHQLESHTEAREQRRRLWRVGLAGLAAGMMVWAVLAGSIARMMPRSWLLPELMAARSLRMPMWHAGQRLMQAGDAQAFAGMLAGNRLATANQEALEACRKQAARADKADKAVRCTIEVGGRVGWTVQASWLRHVGGADRPDGTRRPKPNAATGCMAASSLWRSPSPTSTAEWRTVSNRDEGSVGN